MNQRMDNSRGNSEMVDKLIGVRRVAKTVKGGRRMAFGALVVVGDEAGRVGWGKGKAREVPEAVRKATDEAKRGMVRVPMRQGRTIHHEIQGRFGSTRVILKPAVPGTGIIAGGPMRAVFEAMGIKDVVSKVLGSTNPYNMVQATFNAFANMETPRKIAAKRGLKVTDLTLHREEASKGEVDQKEVNEAAADVSKKQAAKKAAMAKAAPKKDDKGGKKPARKSDGKKDEPQIVAVTKGESMKAAVSKPQGEAKAEEKPAEVKAEAAPQDEAKVEETKADAAESENVEANAEDKPAADAATAEAEDGDKK